MTKIDRLLNDADYRAAAEKIERLEANRIYCRHGLNHSLDVARIAWVIVLEEKLAIQKAVVYGAALIHDIGRGEEYESGEPHDAASVRLGRPMLYRAGFSEDDTQAICAAIAAHRQSAQTADTAILSQVLYRADKLSRPCFWCPAREGCYWPETKKNNTLYI